MKKLLTLILILACSGAFAQDSLKNFNHARNRTTETGMEVLGGWALGNIAVGSVYWNTTSGSTKYFHQMNIMWNVVNFGAAVSGFSNVQRNKNKTLSAAESLKQQKKIEKVFLVNGILDVAYIGGGIYMQHRGNINNSDQLRGFGSSVIMQGAFLLLFDGVMYNAQKHNGSKLRNFLEKNPITFDGRRVGIVVNM